MNKKIGIILGSGLNKFTEELDSAQLISKDETSFHNLRVYKGKIAEKEIILFSGRRHFYEGYNITKVLESVNLAKKLGVETLIVTNAAGGLNTGFKVADLMLITSHLNFLNKSITSANCSDIYNRNLLENIKQTAKEENIILRNGSYCYSQGPMYETRAEIKYLSKYGIDAVGMSTVPEILHANKIGMKTIAVSCITNLLNENSVNITNHEEVLAAGEKAFNNFSKLLKKLIKKSHEFF